MTDSETIRQATFSYDDIVPEEYQTMLLALRDNIRANSFQLGDIALAVRNDVWSAGLNLTQNTIWDAVGSFVGYSARTIRYYAETAEFYGKDDRDRYDILPFSHFVFARYQGSPDCYRILDHAMLYPGLSEAALERWWHDEMYPISQPPIELATEKDNGKDKEPKPSPQVEQEVIGHTTVDLVVALNDMVNRVDALLSDVDYDDGVFQELALHVSAIKSLIPKIKVTYK